MQRLLDKAGTQTDELDAYHKLKTGPYAFGWSEKTGALFVRPWKRQLWIRDWWRKARRWGYRRPRGTYDDAAAKRRVEAAMAAEVAGWWLVRRHALHGCGLAPFRRQRACCCGVSASPRAACVPEWCWAAGRAWSRLASPLPA